MIDVDRSKEFQKKHNGLDSRFEVVKPLLNLESRDTVLILEIYGESGIGKTTLALDIYNKIKHQFEAASFLDNVREASDRWFQGIEILQMTLLSKMGEETDSMYTAGREIKHRLRDKRVLLVLDSVYSIKQLEALAGGSDWFGSGSRIIITTRDKSLVDNYAMNGFIIEKYKIEEMNIQDSMELFCWNAFDTINPAKNFEDLTTLAVSYAKGVPFVLVRLGYILKGMTPNDWEMILEKLNKGIRNAEIQPVLASSYDSLLHSDQQIFLDIACFFKGEKWEYVKRVIMPYISFGIRALVMKYLINIDENGCLDMHDIIQDMAKQVIINESPNINGRSRLWDFNEVLHVLRWNEDNWKIQGIILDPPSHKKIYSLRSYAFEKMENLRILIVRNTTFSTAPHYLPNSLRLLDWKGYPSESFPNEFYPSKIVDFNLLHSSLSLKNRFKMFLDLTFINLSECQSITRIPDVSGSINLRVLTLDRCRKLVTFPDSIGFMPKLACLSASKCTKLESFVPKIDLPSLEVLSFNLCKRLEHFPDVTRKMDKPLRISMIGTAVKRLPNSVGNLTGLEYIDMSFCRRLDDLSSTFFLLPKLATLRIDGCSQLRKSFI
ncbi:TMV resistance protein N-like, partial [Trifolium medium]|nr:TMV resistance protein N-like [Trifolium medium]